MFDTNVAFAAHWDRKVIIYLFIYFVTVKSEFQFVIYEVFLCQCGKADTIQDYAGGGAHTCVSEHRLISISLSREPAGC